MRTDILLIIFYVTISVLSGLCFFYEFSNYQKTFMILLEFFVLAGSCIYFGYLAIKNIMGSTTVTTTTVDGWFRYTLYFTLSSKFLFCLIHCTTVYFIYELIKSDSNTTRDKTTLDTLVLIFTYGILPLANLLNLTQYVKVMRMTSRYDITAIFILSLIWFIYMMIMDYLNQKPKFTEMFSKCFSYTFLRIFIVISGLPLHDYFFLYNSTNERLLI
jgi:hypothetical protein